MNERDYDQQLSDAAMLLAGEVPAGKKRDLLIELSRRFKPEPEYPDGTIAWVDVKPNWHQVMVRSRGKWRSNPDASGVHDEAVTKVEPLRVLSDDEIPLPRSTFAGMTWEDASKRAGMHVVGSPNYNIWSAIADALRDEGDRP